MRRRRKRGVKSIQESMEGRRNRIWSNMCSHKYGTRERTSVHPPWPAPAGSSTWGTYKRSICPVDSSCSGPGKRVHGEEFRVAGGEVSSYLRVQASRKKMRRKEGRKKARME